MCIITKDGLYDLGVGREGTVITFAEGCAWFTFEGKTVKLPTEDIDQIISFEGE